MDEEADSKKDISRSGRVRKKPKSFADFETQENIDEDITVKLNQNSDKTAKNVSLECRLFLIFGNIFLNCQFLGLLHDFFPLPFYF